MNHWIARLLTAVMTCFAGVMVIFNFSQHILALDTLPEDAPRAVELLYAIIRFGFNAPSWALIAFFIVSLLVLSAVYRHTYAREVVIKSDNALVDLRSSPEIVLDFSGGNNAYVRPTTDTLILPPISPNEGVFRLFVLFGQASYKVTFSPDFEVIGTCPSTVRREAGRLYEFQIVVVRDGRSHRTFVSDSLAYIAAVEQLGAETQSQIDVAARRARNFAFIH